MGSVHTRRILGDKLTHLLSELLLATQWLLIITQRLITP